MTIGAPHFNLEVFRWNRTSSYQHSVKQIVNLSFKKIVTMSTTIQKRD